MPDIKFSNQYPYTDFHELNLDWVIKEVKYWSTKVGKTIQSIELTGTVGLVDTYTITYSDGSTSTFDVTNGNGIASVAKTGTAGLIDTYTITFQDGSTTTFDVHNGTASIDDTLTRSGWAADAKAVGDEFDKIRETILPTEYASLTAQDAVIESSGLIGRVTITDDGAGTVHLKNSAGINGNVAFPLNDLPYADGTNITFLATVADAVSPITIWLTWNSSLGNPGNIYATFTSNGDGTYSASVDLSTYPYASYGVLYLSYNMRYNQTSELSLSLSATEAGDTEKTLIKNTALEDIEINNLSASLQNIILNGPDYPTLYEGKEICTFNKGVAIGDSLTAGVFNTNDGGVPGYELIASYSYPAKLKQISGIDIVNLGDGGYTSDAWYTAHQNDDFSTYQFAIIQLGVNDAMQYGGWTPTSNTAFTNIINKLLTDSNGIFVFVSTIIPATSYSGPTYDAVSQGIRDLIESINNNHVILLDMAEYGNTKKKTGYNNGHLSAIGYERLALDYFSYISYIISQNATLFRNIQFIGTTHVYP